MSQLGRLLAPLLVALTALWASPSLAQAPAVVEELKLVTADDSRATFYIRFSPEEPNNAAVNTNPTRPELIMRQTLRAPRVPARSSWRGLVRATNFQNSDSGLSLLFETTGPAKATVEPAANSSIQIVITKLTDAEAIGSRPLGSSGEAVVPASEIPSYVDFSPGDSYELVPLKYADVSEVIGLLVPGEQIQPNNVFIRREPGFGSLATLNQPNYISTQNQAQAQQIPLGQAFPGSGLAIDRRLNAVWVTGPPDRIARVKQQIALIDIPVDSVILETQFVELSETGARNLGLDFAKTQGQLAVGTISVGASNPFGEDIRRIIPSGQIQAAIYAQVQKGEGRIVSRPRIAAQSGSTAKIITGDALPILTSITLSGVNAVSQQVQYVNVGVTLQIAPRVSPDGFVTSQIYAVVSSVTGYSEGYPTISQREAETSASVRDGETYVIGGLTQENVLNSNTKVPLLGDIPLAGALFRYNSSTRAKTELYIVITPHIVRHRRFELTPEELGETPPTPPPPLPPVPASSVPTGSPIGDPNR